MQSSVQVFACLGASLMLALVCPGKASAETRASAEPGPPAIWYRSSEGCPDGAEFVGRLRGKAKGGRIAEVGDSIDFVVTLGTSGARSSGKLERQTAGSAVAVRQLEAESCAEVADALALTLELSLDSSLTVPSIPSIPSIPSGTNVASQQAASEPPPRTLGPESAAAAADPFRVEPSLASSDKGAAPARADAGLSAKEKRSPCEGAVWLFGGQGGVSSGLTSNVGPAGGLFVDLDPAGGFLPELSTRLTLRAAHAESSAPHMTVTTGALRLEGCPVKLGSSALSVRPCVGLEMGAVRALSGEADTGPWASAVGHVRLAWSATSSVVLEAQAGATLPWIHYTLRVPNRGGWLSYRLEPIGLSGMLGGAWRLE